ncbi:hypothetical protein Fot_29031 [Forsythia ovata]|uniref:Uncharacterized protein n=1 Tax=Forsythia ovata TaxID=205694 RepID=A0ABD1TRI3_9LAMI
MQVNGSNRWNAKEIQFGAQPPVDTIDIRIGQLRRLVKDSHRFHAISKFWHPAPHSLPRSCKAHRSRRSSELCEALLHFHISGVVSYVEFYFSSVPKLKIRHGGIVDNISPPPPVPSAASVSRVTVLQTPETMVGSSSFIPAAPVATSVVSFASSPVGAAPSSENSRRSGKRNEETSGNEGTFCTPVLPPVEFINIDFHQDELDPTILGKLPVPAAIAAASVHKYWTSAFEKATDNVELLKLAEMYTSQSHVLNYELYKVLTMKVDELRSTVGGDEDVNALRSENKDLRE